MSEFDLNEMSLSELKKLQKELVKAITTFETRKKAEALAALEDRAREFGFKLEELTGVATVKTRASAAAKYAHPENASVTWSGRGRQPQWLKDELAAGKSLADFAI